ncbi:hypothetical protein [Saccharothrix syringae]|uniref:Uncharacterized protein n=1 Tax=Saccharothrix syringae TaxID=103733 RepID=A0A5Q0HAR1_SACSY|nr:hypothetical protein [Saccharothrix syringae]QFZ23337.1 hypothetical protein EKG83_43150 [Saccharothrix syringae]
MTKANSDYAQTDLIVKLIKDLGKVVNIPAALAAESKLIEDLRRDEFGAGAVVASARTDLLSAPTPADYLKAREALSTALVTTFGTQSDAFRAAEADALYRRAVGSLYDHSNELQSALSERFNDLVAAHSLNDAAASLPDFADPYLNLLNVSPAQASAVATWQNVIGELSAVWSAYIRLARHLGHTFGGSEASENLELAFVLFDIPAFDVARSAAVLLASWKGGTDAAKRYGPLLPFVAGPLSGAALHLKPISDADALWRAVQGI